MTTQGPPTLEAIIGYNPWTFPQLVDPAQDLGFVLYGLTYRETAECLSILAGARKRWKSSVYIGLAVAVVFQLVYTTLILVGVGASPKVTGDLVKGPAEFAFGIGTVLCGLVLRLGYFYATVSITLGVFPRDRPVRIMLYLVTALAAVATFVTTVVMGRYQRLSYDQYLLYNETGDPLTVLRHAVADIVPYLKKYFQGVTMFDTTSVFLFIVLTKIPFLLKIYKSLNVGIRESLWSIISSRSSQRLVTCMIVATIEAVLSFSGISRILVSVSCFSKAYQINSLAIVAFEGAAAIIKEHSTASQFAGSQAKSRTQSVVDPNGTLGRKVLLRNQAT